MIEVKATTVEQDGEKGVQIESKVEGSGLEVVNEVLLIIKALMAGLKDGDPLLHLNAIATIAEHKEILLGDGDDDIKAEKAMSELMSKAIIKEGRLN